jgi:hypothetical protein
VLLPKSGRLSGGVAHPALRRSSRAGTEHRDRRALVYLTTWLTIGWIHPTRASEALGIGALWLALTLAFEFLAGHYAFGKDWAVLLEDYDLSRGRIWVMVLIVVLLAPLWTARIRGLLGAQGSG